MTLRRATLADAAAIARLHRASRLAAMPWLPDLHTPEEDLAYFRDEVVAAQDVWLLEAEGKLAAFAAVQSGWLNHLYVQPELRGCGHGSVLLDQAKSGQSSLRLWAFQRNAAARRFYEARGFVLLRLTDGADNEERMPDALYEWTAGPA